MCVERKGDTQITLQWSLPFFFPEKKSNTVVITIPNILMQIKVFEGTFCKNIKEILKKSHCCDFHFQLLVVGRSRVFFILCREAHQIFPCLKELKIWDKNISITQSAYLNKYKKQWTMSISSKDVNTPCHTTTLLTNIWFAYT